MTASLLTKKANQQLREKFQQRVNARVAAWRL